MQVVQNVFPHPAEITSWLVDRGLPCPVDPADAAFVRALNEDLVGGRRPDPRRRSTASGR